MEDELLNTRQVAELIRKETGSLTHPLTVGKLIRSRKLKAINISNGKVRPRYRVYRSNVEEYIDRLKKTV